MFDPRNNVPRIGRVLIARGRDAADVAIATTFGPNTLTGFRVWTDEVIEAHGTAGVRALNAVGTREARQIAMLQKDGLIQVGKQGDELLDVVIRRGDKAAEFIWRNKGSLAVASVLATFVANPDAYIDGALTLPREAARNTNWTILGLTGIAIA